jgi:N-acetylglutamate synthase-like GNAT family acetyltransferase
MEVRPFRDQSDAARCLAVLDSNVPDFFGTAEREMFTSFLSRMPEEGTTFYVMEHAGEVIGCGGFTRARECVRLQWAMIRMDLQKQGLGRFLLLYRLKQAGQIPGVQFVEAEVPARLAAFFEKNGLKPTAQSGIHRMKLQVCAAG